METEALSKGEQTRQQIIQTAYDLFIKQGYHGTSMREISAAADIALGGIYNHFATKEDIFEAVFFVNHPIRKIVPKIMEIQGDTTEAIMRNFATKIVEGLKEQPEFVNLLFVDIVEFQGRYSTQNISKQIPYIQEVYQRLSQPRGGQPLRPIPPMVIARSFFGLFFSYYMTGIILNPNPEMPPEIVDENVFDYFVDIFLHGVLEDDNSQKGGV